MDKARFFFGFLKPQVTFSPHAFTLAFSITDERSEEFRRSVKESLTGPFQTNRSDGIKTGIGIERKINLPIL